MVKKYLILWLLLILLTQQSFSQWTREKGKGYYKLSAWSLVSDQHFTDNGKIDPNATRGYFNINFYGEYGLSDPLDVIVYFPFFSRTYQNKQVSGTTGAVIQDDESLNNIGDADIALRYGIIQISDIVLSTTLKLGIPIGEDSGGTDGSFQTGDGEFNQLLQIDIGVPFQIISLSGYSKAYFGYNNRTRDFSDELHFGVESGLNFFDKKLWLIGRLNRVSSLKNGNLSAATNQGSIFANNIEYTSVSGELDYYFTEKLGISFAVGGALSGRIIYANPAFSSGLFLDVK